MFEFNNVKYRDILDIEHLIIPKHKITCLIGKSGSGKTTLLRLLNKLISFDSGEILYNNHSIEKLDSITLRRQVTMMPQNPIIFPGSIKENLVIGLSFSDKPIASDEILKEILKAIDLDKQLEDNAEKLSGGEKQRLSLGRVLLLDSDVLLLDEPSSSLDNETETIILDKIVKYIKENNKTLIIVTHSKLVAMKYADLIVGIEDGKIQSMEERA